jgi:hypothetical protein
MNHKSETETEGVASVGFSEESPGWRSIYSGRNGMDRDASAILGGSPKDDGVFQEFSRRRAFGGTARSGREEKQDCRSADGGRGELDQAETPEGRLLP